MSGEKEERKKFCFCEKSRCHIPCHHFRDPSRFFLTYQIYVHQTTIDIQNYSDFRPRDGIPFHNFTAQRTHTHTQKQKKISNKKETERKINVHISTKPIRYYTTLQSQLRDMVKLKIRRRRREKIRRQKFHA